MMQALKQYFERRRVRKIFARFVSPSVADDLLDGKTDLRTGQLDERKLEVVYVMARRRSVRPPGVQLHFGFVSVPVCAKPSQH